MPLRVLQQPKLLESSVSSRFFFLPKAGGSIKAYLVMQDGNLQKWALTIGLLLRTGKFEAPKPCLGQLRVWGGLRLQSCARSESCRGSLEVRQLPPH